MKLIQLLIIVIFTFFLNGITHCENEAKMPHKKLIKILVFGDSLSAGFGIEKGKEWAYLLQNNLKESGYNINVINDSISGETTEGESMKKEEVPINLASDARY